MALWVYNPYRDFELQWNGQTFLLEGNEWNLLPDEVIQAYFPDQERLATLLPPQKDRALLVLRSIIEVFLSRWGAQIRDYYDLTGNIEQDIEKFFEFLEKFDISEVRPVKKKEAGSNEIAENIEEKRTKRTVGRKQVNV